MERDMGGWNMVELSDKTWPLSRLGMGEGEGGAFGLGLCLLYISQNRMYMRGKQVLREDG